MSVREYITPLGDCHEDFRFGRAAASQTPANKTGVSGILLRVKLR
jgi:hypothetical protein